MARRKTRPANDAPRASTVVSLTLHHAAIAECDRLRDALEALKTTSEDEIDRLTARVEAAERLGEGAGNLRAEYERVSAERDALAREVEAGRVVAERQSERLASFEADYARLRRQIDLAEYRASCAQADARTARAALAEQSIATHVASSGLRVALRHEGEMDRLNPRVTAHMPTNATFDQPLGMSAPSEEF